MVTPGMLAISACHIHMHRIATLVVHRQYNPRWSTRACSLRMKLLSDTYLHIEASRLRWNLQHRAEKCMCISIALESFALDRSNLPMQRGQNPRTNQRAFQLVRRCCGTCLREKQQGSKLDHGLLMRSRQTSLSAESRAVSFNQCEGKRAAESGKGAAPPGCSFKRELAKADACCSCSGIPVAWMPAPVTMDWAVSTFDWALGIGLCADRWLVGADRADDIFRGMVVGCKCSAGEFWKDSLSLWYPLSAFSVIAVQKAVHYV